MSEKDKQEIYTYPAPDFIHKDDLAREEFLSQLGNFTPQERTIFRCLCERWEPEIKYQRFLHNLDIKNAAGDLNSLITKLQKQRMAILNFKIEEGIRKPESITLSSQDGTAFYARMIDEYYVRLQESLAEPLPFESDLSKQYPHIGSAEYLNLTYLELLRMTAEKENIASGIYRIQLLGGDALLASASSLRWLIHAAIGKLRAFFSNPNYLALAARIQNTSLLEIKQRLNTRNPDFWKDLTTSLLAEEEAIKNNRSIRVGKRFFQICGFIYRYVEAQMQLAEEQRQEREDRDLDMKSIVQAVKDDSSKTFSDDQLTAIIDGLKDKYGKKFPDFKAEFLSRYTKSSHGLPQLVSIGNIWVHIDNLHLLFSSRLDLLRPQLQQYYVKQMETQLRRKNRARSEIFFSKENFEQDILSTVKTMDPFAADCLERPNIISEAMVHYLKTRRKVQSPDDLRAHLIVFFHARNLMFLPLAEIFNLNLGEIFKNGFLRLPLWRQIIIRATGRYGALEEKYIGRSFTSYKRLMKDELKARQDFLPVNTDEGAPNMKRNNQDRNRLSLRADSSKASRSRTSAAQGRRSAIKKVSSPAKKRTYNVNEQEEAWKKFGDSLKD
ncbi:hypothetical protein [Spirochaeta dissipatitropha]